MRILVVGAGGFIGSAVTARLVSDGHSVIAARRGTQSAAGFAFDRTTPVAIDVARATAPEDWLPHLDRVEAAVNCAGVLQDAPGSSTAGVHADGVAALAQACERAGVRRLVHLSAIGVDHDPATEFARTKRVGDQAIMARDLDWVILRPSVVVGQGAYGASALLRGLAALPVMPVMPQTGLLQIIHLDDVVEAIAFFLRPDAPGRLVIELVGPRRATFPDLVRMFRRWLRWPAAREVMVPMWMARATYRLGDLVALLGWRPAIRSTTRREVERGGIGDAARLTELTGITPRDLEAVLAAEPASVQERWFAALYLIKPLLFGVLSLFWIATGLISLGPGWNPAMALLREGRLGESMAALLIIGGAVADIAIGTAIAIRPLTRYALLAAVGLSLAYVVAGTALMPRLWSDPLGSMLKIVPIIVLNLVALAILEDR